MTVPDLRLDQTKVRALLDRARREVDEGNLPSCQVALARKGALEVFETIGEATDESRYVVFSCTKAFVAGAMWALIGDGAIDVQARLVDYVPEFGSNGKDVITVEQVMLHTSGFPRAPLGPPAWFTRAGRLEAFARWRTNWEPGHGLRVPRDLGALGARRDHRAGERDRLPRVRRVTGHETGRAPPRARHPRTRASRHRRSRAAG
jgi:CubicO group peptidase (beta-lactamase class C family)